MRVKTNKAMTQQFSAAFVIPYFGQWPGWINIYLQTCARNSSIKFLIFTDCRIPPHTYENVTFITFSLAAFNKLATEKLGFPVRITQPYKLCDLKPAYGRIFEDYLQDFAFWGVSDIDIIFGNAAHFITPDLLERYDIITARKEYLVGHFTLYRNCEKVNLLYQNNNDHPQIFSRQQYLGFDECGSHWWYLLAGVPFNNILLGIESMTHIAQKMEIDGNIRVHYCSWAIEQDRLAGNGTLEEWRETLLWDNGTLINLRREHEYLYFHFHFLKKDTRFVIPQWEHLPGRFYITSKGLSEKQELAPYS